MIVACPACGLRYDVSGRPPGTEARCRCGPRFRLPEPGESAERLACPACGGPVGAGAARCAFCGSTLATARCPRCFALVLRSSEHCRLCGARLDQPARALADTESPRACPRCSTRTLRSRPQ